MKMDWFKRQIVGSIHYEYRGVKMSDYRYFFDIEKHPNGSIRLYDLRDNPATYYLFKTVGEAKKIAVASIEDKKVLEPYLDKEWYEMSARAVKVMADAQALINNLKNDNQG